MKKALSFLILILITVSCSDESSIQYGNIELYLTGASAPYEKVTIEIKTIKLSHLSQDNNNSQIDIGTYKPEKYDLLELNNGQSTFLASTKIAPGTLYEIIVVLGNNSITTSQGTFGLNSVNQHNLEIVVKINEDLVYETNKTIYLGFDVKSSIRENNGTYYFEPVIKAFVKESTGEIEGIVVQIEANPTVAVIKEGQVDETTPKSDGYFCITGLAEGSYDVVFQPLAPFSEKTVKNVTVEAGEKTNLGTIQLNKHVFATVAGDLNINPSSNEDDFFEMQTPSGLIDMDAIYVGGDTYTYYGAASEIKIKPKAGGRTLNIDGVDIVLDVNSRYTITSTEAEMVVELRNTKNGNGNWWININGENVTIIPNPMLLK